MPVVGGIHGGDREGPSVPDGALDGLGLGERSRPDLVVVGGHLHLSVGDREVAGRACPREVDRVYTGNLRLEGVRTAFLEGGRGRGRVSVDLVLDLLDLTVEGQGDRNVAADGDVVVPGEQGRVDATGEQDTAEQRRDEHGTHGVLLCPEGRHLPRRRALR